MNKYMLISASDYGICTEQFYSHKAAREQMLKEIEDELLESGAMYELAELEGVTDEDGCYDEAAVWDKIKDLDEYNGSEVGDYGFKFDNSTAFCEVSDGYPARWKIVQIF